MRDTVGVSHIPKKVASIKGCLTSWDPSEDGRLVSVLGVVLTLKLTLNAVCSFAQTIKWFS